MKTGVSMTGFVTKPPTLTTMTSGEARCHIRIGQEHYIRNDDGSFTENEPTYTDLVLFRKAAEKAAATLTKGDRFVADGYIHTYQDGTGTTLEEFVARHIGLDLAYAKPATGDTPEVEETTE